MNVERLVEAKRKWLVVVAACLLAFVVGLIIGLSVSTLDIVAGSTEELRTMLVQSGVTSQALIDERDGLVEQLASERDRGALEREALERQLAARPPALVALKGVDLDYLDGEIERGRFAHAYYVEHPESQTPQTGDTEFNRLQVRKYGVLAYVVEQLRSLRVEEGE